jgi:hypothetical protein
MLEKQGFVGLSTGGEGVIYIRPNAITAVQERNKVQSRPELRSRVFLQGSAEGMLVQEDPATIAGLMAALTKKED